VTTEASRQTIALIGSLIPRKGIDVALLALRVICDVRGFDKAPVLHVFGQGREEYALRLLAQQLGIDHLVRFRGQHVGIVNARMGVDLIIIPSREESTSLVLLEAMHAGIPVVASSVGAITEILPTADYGLTVPAESHHELAGAVMKVLDDPDAAASRAREAQERYWAEYTADLMAERTRAVYEDARQR
jgi:glycosyltransferase involved in cell wall biosynthesis